MECIPCESCALPPTSLEHAFPTLDTKTNQFVRMPDTDYIFISLDFHHICGEEPSISLDGPSYRQNPVTEAGIAYLDMRDIFGRVREPRYTRSIAILVRFWPIKKGPGEGPCVQIISSLCSAEKEKPTER
ncbi:hypothetical protein LB505_005365 [Fusarium chuoi]|nr:hypothetical protein LB505_005365 [Fusarium chuoi]